MNTFIVDPGPDYKGRTEECLEIRNHLAAALKHSQGEYSADDLLKMFEEKRLQLWVVLHENVIMALASTQVVEYGRYCVLRVVTLSGENMMAWIDSLVEGFVKFCREQGLSRIEAVGRKGFVRALKNLGFKEVYTTVTKEVVNV